MWVFEPHVAEAVFETMISEAGVPVMRERRLDRSGAGVAMEEGRILSITTTGGETYAGRVFIDATYEGDLMAAAGVSYTVGREGNEVYGETLNGVQKSRAEKHQFEHRIDPYVVPGDPESGLLPRIHGEDPGEDGQGDHRVQAYNFRVCLTRVPENRVPFSQPEGYDPAQYTLLARALQAGGRFIFTKFDGVPNLKTDTNNHGAFSTDNIGMNYDYPEASYERRAEIVREHETYQKGFFYFLANDPSVPEDVRTQMSEWGLAADEFRDNGNWPHQLYIREARRMVSDHVTTELHLTGAEPTPMPVAMGSYTMDSHNVQRYVAQDEEGNAFARNEGDIQVSPGGPYPIGYGAITPRASECTNLLVPVCVSSSHIAYGSVRMEPVFMILGQSAATAASLAVEGDTDVQQVEYPRLAERLLADGQVLEARTGGRGPKLGLDPAEFRGLVIDDPQAAKTGLWMSSTSVRGYLGVGYLHDHDERNGSSSARFETAAPGDGPHEIRISYTAHSNRASNVPVTVEAGGQTISIRIDQRENPPIEGVWITVATVELAAGESVVVTITNEATDGYVIVDAVQLVPAE